MSYGNDLRDVEHRLLAVELRVDDHAAQLREHDKRLDAHDAMLGTFSSHMDQMRGFAGRTQEELRDALAKLGLMHDTVQDLVALQASEQGKSDARALLRRIRYCTTKATKALADSAS